MNGGIGIADTPRADDEFRYERKFVVTEMTRWQVECGLRLHPAMFRSIYHPRFVNSIYFDTRSMRNYRDNVDGLAHRLKARIRWYGDLFGNVNNPSLEIKEKSGLVGTKRKLPVADFTLRRRIPARELSAKLASTDLSHELARRLRDMRPMLLNRYLRHYWLTGDQRFRVTVDTGMSYYRVSERGISFQRPRTDSAKTIVEIKYRPEDDGDVASLTQHFRYRLSKSSKYVTGIDLVHDYLTAVDID